jgi:uncharacterized protein (TIGR02145 family)
LLGLSYFCGMNIRFTRFLLFSFLCFPLFSVSQTITNVGTDFWIAFPQNQDTLATIKLFISSNFTTSGTVHSAYPGVDQGFTVTPGIVTQLTLPSSVVLQGGIEDKGIRILSNDPVTVYGLNNNPSSTDAFLALPVNALGLDYRIITYKTTFPASGSSFSIVATQNLTSLIIFNHQTNITTNIDLDMGQTYYVEAPDMPEDVTGSRIQSNYPVAVFGSVEIGFVPAPSCFFADHMVEQMFPCYSWGKNFVTVPLAGRNGNGDIFRIVAAEDGTNISINGSAVSTINTGDYYETNLTGYNSINTSKATILAQFAKGQFCMGGTTGDPFMMLIPPEEQFLKSYTICNVAGAVPFTSHWVNVVAPDYALGTIYQDGVLIPNGAFVQIGTTNCYGAQRSVTVGSHTFNSTFPFGVFVYGWGPADSYGYPGGCSLSPVGTVNSVTLSPDTSYGQLNITNVCLTANVQDNLLNPVVGVLVNFYISGISPLIGNSYTDASGNAQYCYTQTGVIPGEDHVYAEVFGFTSDTSVVYWSYSPPCTNPTSGGIIGDDQSGCGSYIPTTLINIQSPTGFSGTLEYKWKLSTIGSTLGFTDIAGSNSVSYSPGTVSQTTWFKRLVRVDCMTDWSSAVESNVIEIIVVPPLLVNVTIAASANPICQGSFVTFTATPTNGGPNPSYQWKVNGNSAGTDSPVYNYTPVNGDCIICVLNSSAVCVMNNPDTSNMICMTVDPTFPVSISITATANPVCAGTSVTYTAASTNGGSIPSYLWKVNGVIVGTNNPIYSYIPINGDIISCILTSNILCPTGNPATSNTVTMTVNPNLPVSVSITASANPFCQGSSVIYTAAAINGGPAPFYQWKVNGVNAGTNNPVYSYSPNNGDVVSCVLTSNIACPIGNPATSNSITMIVIANLPAGISISASTNPFCPGNSVTFTAIPVNGGTNPAYQWKVNGINTGTNSPAFSYNPVNGDLVSCILTSNLSCVTGNPATSNTVTMSGTLAPLVTFTACFDTITTTSAKPFKLKGGIPLGGTYSGAGVAGGIFNPAVAGVGNHQITYIYTNAALCSASAQSSVLSLQSAVFSCGNNLVDIRDNKTYATVQIGSQCWMASNLNYGTMVTGNSSQRDNCIWEKYCFNDVTANCGLQTYYQWDELMQYDEEVMSQGLCPPAWHVPSEADWNNLFVNYTNNAFAGSPLKYSGFSGFDALLNGARHLNSIWDYSGFAGFFWSSTTHGSLKALAHGMNDIDPSVAAYPSFKNNAFAVRCVKD